MQIIETEKKKVLYNKFFCLTNQKQQTLSIYWFYEIKIRVQFLGVMTVFL